MKIIKNIVVQLLVSANLVTVLMLLLTGYADRINPLALPWLSNLGLFFPIFLVFTLLFLIVWLFIRKRMMLITVVGLIISYPAVRAYSPFNLPKEVPSDAIKILSYNVWMYQGWEDPEKMGEIVEYLDRQDAHIVCLQEAEAYDGKQKIIDQVMNKHYQYQASSLAKSGSDKLAIYSKFPILKQEEIDYGSFYNHSTAFHLDIEGDTVVVINCHFESTGISSDDKVAFQEILKGKMDRDSVPSNTKNLLAKLNHSTTIRALQVETVAQYIRKHADKSIVLCGDFNDAPNSFVRKTIANELQDCYVNTGNGPGISYHSGGLFVRIDNIMCSNHWISYGCKVDNKIKNSDHYPIYCWLKKSLNP